MRYLDIPKRTRNAIKARVQSTVDMYGYAQTRACVNRYFNSMAKKKKLENQIQWREDDLLDLKDQLKKE